MTTFKNLYTIVARDISTDAVDQMNSILKIIDKFTFGYNPTDLSAQGITLGEKPVPFAARYCVATSWYFSEKLKKDTLVTIKVSIKSPDNQDFGGPAQEHQLPAGIEKININFNMEGMPVTKAGTYKLVVQLLSGEGEQLARGEYPFIVELTESSEKPQPKQ